MSPLSIQPPVSAPGGATPAHVLRQFRVVFNAVKTHFRQVEQAAGLGGAQVWALSVIRDQPGIGVKELARTLDIKQSTASNLVRALLERDMVDAVRDGPDRRTVALHLRDAGAAVLARAPGPFAGVLPGALNELDAATLARLEADLGQLIKLLGADADADAGTVPLADL
jgi:DNA-binding MarR family transcriptional regulator